MSLRLPRSVSALAHVVVTTLVACNFGFYQGQDRPEDPNVLGPPPPADFHCERGERRNEVVDGGSHGSRVVHVLGSGEVICSTEDRNNDGKIDTWNRIENGQVIEQVTDTDFDGRLDRRARDTKKSGTLDEVTPFAPLPPLRDAGRKP